MEKDQQIRQLGGSCYAYNRTSSSRRQFKFANHQFVAHFLIRGPSLRFFFPQIAIFDYEVYLFVGRWRHSSNIQTFKICLVPCIEYMLKFWHTF